MTETVSWKKGVAEFVGTLALIYIGVLVLVVGAPELFENGIKNLVAVALAHGLTIAVMVSATMSISGGQLNPSVTLGLLLANKITPAQAGVNVVAQILGGVVGAVLALASVAGASIEGGVPAAAANVGIGQGILVEAMATFFLVFVVFGTGVDPRFGARIGGLAIGFTVALDILAVGPLTGASMNLARWLGPAIVAGKFPSAAIHIIGPLVGGAVAGLLWQYVLLDEPRPHPEPAAKLKAEDNL
ncbi:MAG: aquaporin [Armatimonadota bacterium]|nr:aquaporin [Armatimonadota bacterium]